MVSSHFSRGFAARLPGRQIKTKPPARVAIAFILLPFFDFLFALLIFRGKRGDWGLQSGL